jgi:nicotinamide mononucleotide transporter
MSLIEIIAAIFGFLCVWFYIVRNQLSWPTGLVQVVLLIVVFRQAKLYADMNLHIVYAVLQLYGWWEWARQNRTTAGLANEVSAPESTGIKVKRLALCGHVTGIAAVVLMTGVFVWLLRTFTDASLPIPDSFVAATSLVAQFLLIWRYVETWWYWIVVDIVGIGLFAFKQLYPTTVLYVLFLVMAIVGLRTWQAVHQRQLSVQVSGA